MFNGVSIWFNAFQTSVNLIWAFIRLTDSIFTFNIRVLVWILSLILLLFRNLINLFCANWMSCNIRFWLSFADIFTFPSNWRSYLILDLNRLSATLISAFYLSNNVSARLIYSSPPPPPKKKPIPLASLILI